MKKILSILGILIIIAMMAIFGYIKYQNRETIVDLGNGWKSYHHNKIGITVKVPENAIINRSYNDEHIIFSASFPKGLIRAVGVDRAYYGKWKNKREIYEGRLMQYRNKAKEKVVEENTEYANFQGKKVKIGKIAREVFYDTKLNEKEVFIRHLDEQYEDNQNYYKPHNTLSFIVIAYGKNYFININIQELYKQNPYLNEVPFEKLGNEFVKIIEPYILRIDSP